MTEFYGLYAKLYHYVLENGSVKSKHKGISVMGMKNTATNALPHTLTAIGSTNIFAEPEDEEYDPMTMIYRDCLFDEKQFYAKNIGFRTKNHKISMVEVNKKASTPFDDKRWILSDGFQTLAYGHWRINAYHDYVKSGKTHEEAEKLAMTNNFYEK